MALPTTGISTSLVKATIGASTNDVGQLCTHPNVNRWSKWKPIRLNRVEPISSMDLYYGKYGLNIPRFTALGSITTPGSLLYILKNDTVTWDYLKPRGGASNEHYRLGDFRSYEHASIKPYKSDASYETFVPQSQSVVIWIDSDFTTNDAYNVTLYDLYFQDINLSLGDCYLGGMLFKPATNDYLIATAERQVGFNDLGVLFPNMLYNMGDWKIAFFLSSVPFANNVPTSSGYFFPLELGKSDVSIESEASQITMQASGQWVDLDTGILYDIQIINNLNYALNLTNVEVRLVSTTGSQLPEDGVIETTNQYTSGFYIAANSTDSITGESLLFTRDINKNYWLGVYFDQGFIQYVPVM